VTLPTVGWTIDLPVPLEQLLPGPWEREGDAQIEEGWKEVSLRKGVMKSRWT
jgi:hypothetical protein